MKEYTPTRDTVKKNPDYGFPYDLAALFKPMGAVAMTAELMGGNPQDIIRKESNDIKDKR